MNSRRIFLKEMCNISVYGGFLVAKPTIDFLGLMKKIDAEFKPHEFDAWEDEFQAIYADKKGALDAALQSSIKGETRTSFAHGEGKLGTHEPLKKYAQKANYKQSLKKKNISNEMFDGTYDYFSGVPSHMSSPYGNIHLHKEKGNSILGHQCFRATNYGDDHLIMFTKTDFNLSKETTEDFLLIHPQFNHVIANKKYFCYGTPVEMPTINYCEKCRKYYHTQIFCYNKKDPVYGAKPVYTQFISDPYCKYVDENNYQLHNGVKNVAELVPCKCYDDIKPVIMNSGNLDKQ